MSTTTPTTNGTEVEPTDTEPTTAARSHPGTAVTGRPDRRAASSTSPPSPIPPSETGRGASAVAHLTFDPFCTRRLRNCIDEANAAFPDAQRDSRFPDA